MAGKTLINQAQWMGDVEITAVTGMEKEFEASVSALILDFWPVVGVSYYLLTVNPGAYQGAGPYLSGSKKVRGGGTLKLDYNIKKFTVVAYDASDVALAIGEVGYIGLMEDSAIASYLVVTP